jgi:hypothetical protein
MTAARLQLIAWDRLFFDPHSAEADFSDAGYLGREGHPRHDAGDRGQPSRL